MPSSSPPPGRPGAPPRRGMGGLAGLLAVLAFVILAAVILTRRGPGEAVPVPPPTTAAAAPTTTMAPLPSDAPPSAEPAVEVATVVSPEPAPVTPPAGGKTPRSPRRAGTKPGSDSLRTADSGPVAHGGTGLPPSTGLAPRRFVLGTTSIESLKPVQRDLKGFEVDNVGVKRAPEVNGRVELEMDPPAVRPGVDYTVKVFLANDGSKEIAIAEVKASTVENGRSTARGFTPQTRLVKPKQRVLLGEISGVWREVVRTWAMDVVVTSGRQDVYRNGLHWE